MVTDHAETVHEEEELEEQSSSSSSVLATVLKLAAASAFLYSAVSTYNYSSPQGQEMARRQLSAVGDSIPSYMDPLMKDLRERKKLFEDTPPEEVKYWFEYAGPLQVSEQVNSAAMLLYYCTTVLYYCSIEIDLC
jgi:hypothetical protein